MILSLRSKSLITGNDNLGFLYELKSFPAFIGCTSKPGNEDVFADMTWMICKDSGMIQLKSLLPLEFIYSEYHSEAVGTTWQIHHKEFSEFIRKYYSGDILEIGGSNGTLAKIFQNNVKSRWTIVEPNPSFNGDEKIKVIKAFFDDKIAISNSIGTIVHSHVLEHLLDPNTMLRHIKKILPKDGYHIFSIPNLFQYLKHKYSNAINFEHTFFLTEYFMDYLLNLHGFEIIEKQYYQDHSIFYATRKNEILKKMTLMNHCEEYQKLYLDMIDFYDSEVIRFNQYIKNFSGKIFLFGAHIFSQFLLHRGLEYGSIQNIIDNSPTKERKRLYGTSLIVQNPRIISNISDVSVILKAGQYQEEVKRQLLLLNPNVMIWE